MTEVQNQGITDTFLQVRTILDASSDHSNYSTYQLSYNRFSLNQDTHQSSNTNIYHDQRNESNCFIQHPPHSMAALLRPSLKCAGTEAF